MWQLDSNPAVVTKVLPTDVLELARLLGSLPTHQLTIPVYQLPSSRRDDSPAKAMYW